MSCVPVRGCRIGEGRPKVILPIVERTEAAILKKAAAFSTLCADCVEWRVDLFEAAAFPLRGPAASPGSAPLPRGQRLLQTDRHAIPKSFCPS